MILEAGPKSFGKTPMRICFGELAVGNADFYGFASAQKNIRQALELQGVKIALNADVELFHIGPHMYRRNPNRFSILWPPYEASAIAKNLVDKINEADLVIASCEDNKRVFLEGGVYKPICVCRLGIDTKIFWYRQRTKSTNKLFRFFWLGQPDIRKGWDIVVEAFQMAFGPNDLVELYLKTTGKEQQDLIQIADRVWLDSRNLALADLLDLYHSSHVFVFPSRGEGTGLPALEAMATGLLVMAPPAFGLADFVNSETGIPLEFDWIEANYGVPIKAPGVDPKKLSVLMQDVYKSYGSYVGRTFVGRRLVEEQHSLRSMGKSLISILEAVL